MCGIFDIDGDGLDIGYVNIKAGLAAPEREMRDLIESLWAEYEPYADCDFCEGFAQDVDGRFWEMLLGVTLLHSGHQLLHRSERSTDGGQPDLCVVEEDRRTWIEAIAPTKGEEGSDQVPDILPINEGGGVVPVPLRETQLRTTSAFWTKSQRVQAYLEEGVIGPSDRRIIAISASRFAAVATEDPPLIMSSLFPIGAAFVRVDRNSGNVIEEGYNYAPTIERLGGEIPRTAFSGPEFSHVSGVLWSRIGLGNLSRQVRPLTMVHNPYTEVPIDQGWGPWDKEYVVSEDASGWVAHNIREHLHSV